MRSLVIGAGIVGRAAAIDLARRGFEVTIADISAAFAEALAGELGVASSVVDASDRGSVAGAIAEARADVVVSAAPYHFGEGVAAAAIEERAHYLDFGGNRDVVLRQLELDDAAGSAGVAVVPDGGLAPGLINVLAEGAMETLGDGPVREVRMRVGALPRTPTGPLGYALEFSPQGLINEYSEPCDVVRKRRHTTVEPLTSLETIEWDGIGTLEAFHTSGGSSTMPSVWESRVHELDYKTLRYPGHAFQMQAVAQLGFFDTDPVSIDGVEVAPRDVLVHALGHRLDRHPEDIVLGRAWATAIRLDAVVSAGYQLVDIATDGLSALARTTAFPVTALAELLCRDRINLVGASPFHRAVRAGELLPELDNAGLTISPWVPERHDG